MKKYFLLLKILLINLLFLQISFAQTKDEACMILAIPASLPYKCNEDGLTEYQCDLKFKIVQNELKLSQKQKNDLRDIYNISKKELYNNNSNEIISSEDAYTAAFYVCKEQMN